jgi:pimeloyl-ACP methyl ester carboxylesterase
MAPCQLLGPWQEFFGQAGYDAIVPGWPGDQDTVELARANPDSVADKGIDDVTDHYAAIIDALPAPPIIIGHSFGGMIAEKLLGMNKGAAAIGIDAAQIKGVLRLPLSSLHATLPVFKNPANKHKAVSLTAKQFHSSFGNALPEEESNELYEKWAVPSPGRPLFEAAAASLSPHSPDKVDTDNPDRGPFCSLWAGRTAPCPKPSSSPPSSSTGTRRPRPTWSSSKIGATR